MTPFELVATIALLFLVAGVATFVALRQRRTLQELRHNPDLAAEERRFIRQQVIRRIAGVVLLAALAGLLIGWFFIEPDMSGLTPPADGALRTEEQKDAIRFFAGYWITALLVLLALLAVAGLDLWATARFGLRQHRRLEQDRRQLFKDEAARLRQRRSEMN